MFVFSDFGLNEQVVHHRGGRRRGSVVPQDAEEQDRMRAQAAQLARRGLWFRAPSRRLLTDDEGDGGADGEGDQLDGHVQDLAAIRGDGLRTGDPIRWPGSREEDRLQPAGKHGQWDGGHGKHQEEAHGGAR